MQNANGPSGEFLLLLAMAVSIQIAEGKNAEDLAVISAFFDVLADNLELIAARRAQQLLSGENAARDGGPNCKISRLN